MSLQTPAKSDKVASGDWIDWPISEIWNLSHIILPPLNLAAAPEKLDSAGGNRPFPSACSLLNAVPELSVVGQRRPGGQLVVLVSSSVESDYLMW